MQEEKFKEILIKVLKADAICSNPKLKSRFEERIKKNQEEREIKKEKWAHRKIYFIQAETGEIKIGSANDVKKRMMEINCHCPHKLKLLKAIKIKYFMEEKEILKKFREHKKKGEWFYPAPEILKFIETL